MRFMTIVVLMFANSTYGICMGFQIANIYNQ